MKTRAILGAAAIAVAAMFTLAACNQSQPSGQAQENKQQRQDTKSLVNNQPLPHFNWSQIRQTTIDTETIQAEGTQTTSFFFNQGTRDPVMSCPSLGLPVPNTAQLSNPDQIVPDPNSSSGSVIVGQMDPNGIYAPSNSTGTSVECVSLSGKPYITYWEGFVYSVTAHATWDYRDHVVKVLGAPTFVPKTKTSK